MQRFPIYPVVLTTAFVALDIAGKIDWSVWWLVSPCLFAVGLAVAIGLLSGNKDR